MLESSGKDFKIAIIIKFSGAKGKSIYIYTNEKLGNLNQETE